MSEQVPLGGHEYNYGKGTEPIESAIKGLGDRVGKALRDKEKMNEQTQHENDRDGRREHFETGMQEREHAHVAAQSRADRSHEVRMAKLYHGQTLETATHLRGLGFEDVSNNAESATARRSFTAKINPAPAPTKEGEEGGTPIEKKAKAASTPKATGTAPKAPTAAKPATTPKTTTPKAAAPKNTAAKVGKVAGAVVGAAAGALVPGAGETGASEVAGGIEGAKLGEKAGQAIGKAVDKARAKSAANKTAPKTAAPKPVAK
jgi:hypothetical protein